MTKATSTWMPQVEDHYRLDGSTSLNLPMRLGRLTPDTCDGASFSIMAPCRKRKAVQGTAEQTRKADRAGVIQIQPMHKVV